MNTEDDPKDVVAAAIQTLKDTMPKYPGIDLQFGVGAAQDAACLVQYIAESDKSSARKKLGAIAGRLEQIP